MNADTIREWLNRPLFEPFELQPSNGEAILVQHPEVVAIGKNWLALVGPETDRVVHFGLVHVNSIAALQAT